MDGRNNDAVDWEERTTGLFIEKGTIRLSWKEQWRRKEQGCSLEGRNDGFRQGKSNEAVYLGEKRLSLAPGKERQGCSLGEGGSQIESGGGQKKRSPPGHRKKGVA